MQDLIMTALMVSLGDNLGENDFENTSFKYYFYDEPYKRNKMSTVANYAAWLYTLVPQAKLIVSDYYWPDNSCIWFPGNDGAEMKLYLNTFSNLYIYFDGGKSTTLCGNVHDYWDEYKAFYGIPVKNYTNQIFLAYHSENWGDLLSLAMAWSIYGAMNPIWVYADDGSENESMVTNFCYAAWQTHWLLQSAHHYVVTWQCNSLDPCVYCQWPDEGNWHIIYQTIDDYQWMSY
jgi:hypothetical protein